MLDRLLHRNQLKVTVRREGELAAATFTTSTTKRKIVGQWLDSILSHDLSETQNLGVELALGRAGKLQIIAGESLDPTNRLRNPRLASLNEGIALILGMVHSDDEAILSQVPSAQMALNDLCQGLPDSLVKNLRTRYSTAFKT